MKKIFAIAMVLVMLVCINVTAWAVPNGFVSSPSSQPGPGLVGFESESDDCTADLDLIPYSEREKLDEEDRKQIEDAYEDITNAKDLTELTDALKKIAEQLGIDPADLAVSDLFSIIYTDCLDHDEHGNFDITLKPETTKGFVSLIRLNGDKWEVVDGAKVSGNHLVFNSDAPYPFAIVVNTGSAHTSPDTGDNSAVFYLIVMIASASGLAFVWKKSKQSI